MRRGYRFNRDQVSAALTAFAGLPRVTLEDAALAAKALEWMRSGLDFADALHLEGGGMRGLRQLRPALRDSRQHLERGESAHALNQRQPPVPDMPRPLLSTAGFAVTSFNRPIGQRAQCRADDLDPGRRIRQPVCDPGTPLLFSLFLYAQILVCLPGRGRRAVPGRFWHARRDVRDPDPGADAQDAQANADRAVRHQILGRGDQFDALVKYGTISAADLDIFHRTNSLDDAYDIIINGSTENASPSPDRCSNCAQPLYSTLIRPAGDRGRFAGR